MLLCFKSSTIYFHPLVLNNYLKQYSSRLEKRVPRCTRCLVAACAGALWQGLCRQLRRSQQKEPFCAARRLPVVLLCFCSQLGGWWFGFPYYFNLNGEEDELGESIGVCFHWQNLRVEFSWLLFTRTIPQ